MISSGVQRLHIKGKDFKNVLTIASGGISSSIAGGNFWAGVRQGLITSGLNHVAHQFKKRYFSYILRDKEGAHGAGHMGTAVTNQENGVTLISNDGVDVNNDGKSDGSPIGKSLQIVKSYKSINALLKENPQYDSYFKFEINKETALTIYNETIVSLNSTYVLGFNDCSHVAEIALRHINQYKYAFFSLIKHVSRPLSATPNMKYELIRITY